LRALGIIGFFLISSYEFISCSNFTVLTKKFTKFAFFDIGNTSQFSGREERKERRENRV
jgi:hypothetical protein